MSDACVISWADEIVVCQITVDRLFRDDDIQSVRREVLALLSGTPALRIGFDLTLVGAVSSRFLGVLIELRTAITKGGGAVALFGTSPKVLKVLEVTQMIKVLPTVATRADALKTLRK